MDPNNDLNMENNEFPEIIEDDDSVEDDDEELDNSGRSSSASPMICKKCLFVFFVLSIM